MTLADMMAADMAKLTATRDFGGSATYKKHPGSETTLTVVLFEESTETPESNGVKTKLRQRHCAWSAAELSNVSLRATVTVNSEDWEIAQVVHQDDYQVVVRLERHELHEQTRPQFRRQG